MNFRIVGRRLIAPGRYKSTFATVCSSQRCNEGAVQEQWDHLSFGVRA